MQFHSGRPDHLIPVAVLFGMNPILFEVPACDLFIPFRRLRRGHWNGQTDEMSRAQHGLQVSRAFEIEKWYIIHSCPYLILTRHIAHNASWIEVYTNHYAVHTEAVFQMHVPAIDEPRNESPDVITSFHQLSVKSLILRPTAVIRLNSTQTDSGRSHMQISTDEMATLSSWIY